ncbi:MAG: homocysteine S-methyltransferase family protein, partial [Acutalibacteraceae bacterium]
MGIKEKIKEKYVYLDGALGTMIQKRGLPLGEVPESLSVKNPEEVSSIHREYVEKGAEIILTNTFGANRYKLKESGYSVKEIISASVNCAKKAVEGTSALVALDIGPIGKLLEPSGTMTIEECYDMYKEMLLSSKDYDIIYFETMTDLLELKTAVLCAKENTDKPVFCTMTFEENGRTFQGVTPGAMAVTLSSLGVDAVGINCSLGPLKLAPIVKEIAQYTSLPIIAKPNAGLPDPITNEYSVNAEEFADEMKTLIQEGATILGGCCGTTPDFIKEIKKLSLPKIKEREIEKDVCICTSTKVVE